MGDLALPSGSKGRNTKGFPFSPEQFDFVVPAKACPHSSGVWGYGLPVPGVDLLGKPAITVHEQAKVHSTACHRKCAKFVADSDDDPSDKKGSAKGRCSDLIVALEARTQTRHLAALGNLLGSPGWSGQFPDMEEGLAAAAAPDTHNAKDTQ